MKTDSMTKRTEMDYNVEMLSDSYKYTHHGMMIPNTEIVYSYWEARNGAMYDETVFFGLQYFMKRYLVGQVVTREGIEEAAEMCAEHFGDPKYFDREMWEYILEKYDGKLPVRIKAVPEGMVIPIDNVMVTIENTDKKCAALTNFLESLLSQMWGASTVATLSREVFKICKDFLEQTSDNMSGLKFMLHDFGLRGVACPEAAAILGAGHLVNGLGTDTAIAMKLIKNYYGVPYKGLACSVAATEHSIGTSLGREGEAQVLEHLLNKYPKGILSVVSDSYDIYNFVDNIVGKQFKERILARDGLFVVRPDSGDPEAVTLKVLNLLGKNFGYTENSKGYKVLNPKVKMLWGDGIDIRGIRGILGVMKVNGWSAENIVFGMGGGLLQKINRDTQRFAIKCSAQMRDGKWFDVFKDQIDSDKTSKKGRLMLIKQDDGSLTTIKSDDRLVVDSRPNILQTVFENGELVKEYTFAEIRKNAELK